MTDHPAVQFVRLGASAIVIALCCLTVGAGASVEEPSAQGSVVVTGGEHSCVLSADGRVRCWGHNDAGQLGLGDRLDRGDESRGMESDLPAVDLGKGRTAVAIAAGDRHTCAVLDDRTLKCWGDNTSGQLGLGDNASRGDTASKIGDFLPSVDLGPSLVSSPAGVTAVAAGSSHTCAPLRANIRETLPSLKLL